MKGIKGMALALAAGVLLAVPALRAEGKADHACKQGMRWDRSEGIKPLKKWLDLSDRQAAQCKKIFQDQREAGRVLNDKLQADRAALKVLVDEKAPAGKLTSALAAMGKDAKTLRQQWAQRREALKGILSPLQQAKLVLAFHGGRGAGMGGWQGSRGGFDGCKRRGDGPRR